MNAHTPQGRVIYVTTPATPTVMPPTFQRPEPAGVTAMRAAIAEGRDPVAEFHRGVRGERSSIGQIARPDNCNLMPTRATSESLKASLDAYHAPRIAAIEQKILAAIKAGLNTRLQMTGATGVSDSQASVRLIAMAAASIIKRSNTRPAIYSIIAAE